MVYVLICDFAPVRVFKTLWAAMAVIPEIRSNPRLDENSPLGQYRVITKAGVFHIHKCILHEPQKNLYDALMDE